VAVGSPDDPCDDLIAAQVALRINGKTGYIATPLSEQESNKLTAILVLSRTTIQ